MKPLFKSLMNRQMSSGFWAVVPAAGIGERMQSDRPKQYLQLEDKLVIEHTLQRLASHPEIKGIVIAVAQEDGWWPTVSKVLSCPLYVVIGGKQRSYSVLKALDKLSTLVTDDPWVLVHDAARPCIRQEDINRLLSMLSKHDVGGLLGIPVNDTVKRTGDDNVILETIERQNLWRASTPQMFRLVLLKSALETSMDQNITVTDEASAIEFAGFEPVMVEGHSDNIKITVSTDLALAQLFMQQQRGEC